MINLKTNYGKLSKTEKKVADFLMQTEQNDIPLYITDMAKATQTSEATIVRFAKKLGFNGYQQLKIAVAQDLNFRPINQNITMEDSAHLDGDGFPVQEYTLHILPAIYPDKTLSRCEAKNDMKNRNYNAWVKTYEEFYGKPLEYSTL